MKWYLKTVSFLILCLAPAIALAQADCPDIIKAALDATQQNCAFIGRNQACYGNVTLEAHPQAGLDEDELVFEEPGDLVNVADVSSLTLSPWDETQHTWGISLMKLQANLPATLPGQNVTFLLFGSVAIDNAVVSNVDGPRLQLQAKGDVNVYSAASADQEVIANMADRDSATAIGRIEDSSWLWVVLQDGSRGWVQADQVKADDTYSFLDVVDEETALTPIMPPMGAFYFQTGIADAPCAEAPDSGILVQTPGGSQKISFTANEVDIVLGSTAYLQAQPSGNMTVSVVEGQAEVTAQGVTVTVPAGARVQIPLDANRAASGPPGAVTPYTGRDIQGLPVGIMDRAITVAAPYVEGAEVTAEAVANPSQNAPLISGTWQATSDPRDCDPTWNLGPSVLTQELLFEGDADTGALIMSWADGRIVGWTFERVEDGVYRSESPNEITTITILSPDHFELLIVFETPSDMGCTFSRSDYVLMSAAN